MDNFDEKIACNNIAIRCLAQEHS